MDGGSLRVTPLAESTVVPLLNSKSSLAFAGVVLAAGRSTRMGADKALLEAEGMPLWQRQRDVLLGAGAAEVLLSARPDQAWARTAEGFSGVLHDALPGCGPLVGVTAALERSSCAHVAGLAVDLPAMTSRWFQELAGLTSPGVGAIGKHSDFYEPLAAFYPREFKWLAWEALARGQYAFQPLVARAVHEGLLRVRPLAVGDLDAFRNWNEPRV